ncbi:hypothetical protein HY732_05065 [Candidatus Uhrbacteria bacterium]|nr:hypothetical protein [Candidatus Uhrbacteria bacterium]
MYLFIHAVERERAFLMIVGKKGFGSVFAPEKSVPDPFLHLVYRGKRHPDVLRGIDNLLNRFGLAPKNLKGICVLSGPGQFSFLRSAIVTANTFGWALNIPVVGVYGDDLGSGSISLANLCLTPFPKSVPDPIVSQFIEQGLKKFSHVKRFRPVVPEYGSEPNITTPKKRI